MNRCHRSARITPAAPRWFSWVLAAVAAAALLPSAVAAQEPQPDPGLHELLARALEKNPEARAAFERFRSQELSVARAGRLPEPTLSYSVFLRQVETRVGPQRQKLAYRQMFPWPSGRRAREHAARGEAAASEQVFDAQVLRVRSQVASAYWRLWRLAAERDVHRDHLEILRSLAASALARVKVGSASLADAGQVDVRISRLEDRLAGLGEQQQVALARLRQAVGLDASVPLESPAGAPAIVSVDEPSTALFQSLADHPAVAARRLAASAAIQRSEAARAGRLPDLGLTADWIEVGPRSAAGSESGKDAVALGVTVSLPLWRGRYQAEAEAARADARSREHAARATELALQSQVQALCSRIRDAARQASLYQHTLIPQARMVLESVLGSYQTGATGIAATLLAQQELVELQVGLVRSLEGNASAWAELEAAVGRSVEHASHANDAGDAHDAVEGGQGDA